MSYTALARRYRSTSFDEVVGQEAVARTLRAAIEQDKVAHAYLFSGTRGVGKTSMARIFAKALNAPDDNPPEIAKAIMEGRDTDVIEIDAASNRGVDDARELISNSVYRPMHGRYKVYIVDEVHMLTREAFNALLKTMEEPPSHVKFVLCTTEPEKVPATIQSRCQRFDFRTIDSRRIAEHLASVVDREGMKADPDLLSAVARLGSGSMRDALSLLDRLVASGEKKLTLALLEELLGLAPRDLIDGLIETYAAGDAKKALETADELLRRGTSIDQALAAIIERLRDLMVLRACGPESTLVELAGEDRQRAVGLAARFDAQAIVHMIALCENVADRVKRSSTPRALFDALQARLSLTESLADVAALLRGGGGGAGGGPGSSGGPAKKAGAAAAPGIGSAPRAEQDRRPAPAQAARPAPGGGTGGGASSGDVWSQVVEGAGGTAAARAYLSAMTLRSLDGGRATVAIETRTAMRWAESKKIELARLFEDACGRPVQVELALDETASEQDAGAARPDPRAAAMESPLVQRAMELFDARIVRVDEDREEG